MSKVVSLANITNIPLFSGLSEQDRDAFLKGGHIRHCPCGQMLFAHGEPVKYFYIIVDGTIQLFRGNSDGHEKTIGILKAGQTMCEDEILDACNTHRANATAVEDSTLMEFPASWLRESAKKMARLRLIFLILFPITRMRLN
jgi:CRP-like cAMP-binding protein